MAARKQTFLARLQRQPWLLGLIIPFLALVLLLFCTDSFNLFGFRQTEPGKDGLSELQPQAPGKPSDLRGTDSEAEKLRNAKLLERLRALEKAQERSASKLSVSEAPSATVQLAQPQPSLPPTMLAVNKTCQVEAGDWTVKQKDLRQEAKKKKGLKVLMKPQIPTAIAELAASSSLERKVGASIAVHPPKFYALVMFLTEWMTCLAAFQAMSIYVVFQHKHDLKLFREAIDCLSPGLPEYWVPIVAKTPKDGWWHNKGLGNQYTAAYKKWYGLLAMIDARGPEEYGLMLDSEISLWDYHAKDKKDSACKSNGEWSRLLERITTMEKNKVWPAARVSATLTEYSFGTFKKSGRDYDQHLLRENANFINDFKPVDDKHCQMKSCSKVRRQIDNVLWSWWTDLPWLNLEVAKRMVAKVAKTDASKVESWRDVARNLRFPRFEYVAYQMFTMLYEGFDVRDVTNLTLEAKWGSYLEDPQFGSKLAELKPMWASAETVYRIEDEKLPKFSKEEPPLLIFHVDHENLQYSFGGTEYKVMWELLLLQLLKLHKRKDYSEENIH